LIFYHLLSDICHIFNTFFNISTLWAIDHPLCAKFVP